MNINKFFQINRLKKGGIMKKILIFSTFVLALIVTTDICMGILAKNFSAEPATKVVQTTCYPAIGEDLAQAEHYIRIKSIRDSLKKGADLADIGFRRQDAKQVARNLEQTIFFWERAGQACTVAAEKKVIAIYIADMKIVKDELEQFAKQIDI
jgi:hypothetical protein